MGWSSERPDLSQLPNDSYHVSPRFSRSWSAEPLRRSDSPLESDLTGLEADRPLLSSSPPLRLTYTTRVSLAGPTTVQPCASRLTDIIVRPSSVSMVPAEIGEALASASRRPRRL